MCVLKQIIFFLLLIPVLQFCNFNGPLKNVMSQTNADQPCAGNTKKGEKLLGNKYVQTRPNKLLEINKSLQRPGLIFCVESGPNGNNHKMKHFYSINCFHSYFTYASHAHVEISTPVIRFHCVWFGSFE